MSKQTILSRWKEGTRAYASSIEGQLKAKRIYTFIVLIGLFGGSIQQLIQYNFWMFLVLGGFGFIMLIDYYNTNKQLKNYYKSLEDLKQNDY